jgi:hypothetical protein
MLTDKADALEHCKTRCPNFLKPGICDFGLSVEGAPGNYIVPPKCMEAPTTSALVEISEGQNATGLIGAGQPQPDKISAPIPVIPELKRVNKPESAAVKKPDFHAPLLAHLSDNKTELTKPNGVAVKKPEIIAPLLAHEIDKKILKLIAKRCTIPQISKKLQAPLTTIRRRIKLLEESGKFRPVEDKARPKLKL